jgi:hypothetical protein
MRITKVKCCAIHEQARQTLRRDIPYAAHINVCFEGLQRHSAPPVLSETPQTQNLGGCRQTSLVVSGSLSAHKQHVHWCMLKDPSKQ